MTEVIQRHLAALELSPEASSWLLMVWDCIQGLDDWVDNDEVHKPTKEAVIYKVLVVLPSHPFFLNYQPHLTPVLSNAVLKWIGANHLEDAGEASERSFMWRASYYDLVLEVVRIVHVIDTSLRVAGEVAKMYGETYQDYLKEFKHA